MTTIQLVPLEGIPAIRPGDDLASLLAAAAARANVADGDLLVVCQKAVSKTEGRTIDALVQIQRPLATRPAKMALHSFSNATAGKF